MSVRHAALTIALALSVGSCVFDQLEPEVGAVRAGLCKPEDHDPSTAVSFQSDLMPLIKRANGQGGCACHLPTNRRTSGIDVGGLDLSAYSQMRKGGKQSTSDTIVVPGDPCASVLLQKTTTAPPFGSRMPSDGPPFWTPTERALLSDWIAEGAHDN